MWILKKIYLFIILAFCLLNSIDSIEAKEDFNIFSTLDSVKQYAATLPEYPKIDNNDWMHPDYTGFLKSITPNYFDHFLRWIGIQEPLWSIEKFKPLLMHITKNRELDGYIGRFILKVDPDPGAEFVIFGDFHGAFHSFVRDLSFLKLRGNISEDLLIKSNCYFVFNGNLVDLSPYSLETLTLIMQLMHKNPNKIIYIRGPHEDKEGWHNYSLKKELKIRTAQIFGEKNHDKMPLDFLITRFFNTLPLALYIIVDRLPEKINVVRVSHYDAAHKELKEKNFAGFLDSSGNGKPEMFKLTNKEQSKKNVNISALITSEHFGVHYKKTTGLRMLGKKKGIDTWAIVSSPINTYRRLYEFFYDAFAILKTHSQFEDWTISLCNQDVRSRFGFKESAIYNLKTGLNITDKRKKAEAPKEKGLKDLRSELEEAKEEIKELKEDVQEAEEKREKQLKLGSTLDLTSSRGNVGKAYKNGMLLALDELNQQGKGIKLKLDTLDDEFSPEKARQNVKELLKRGIDILIAPLGSSILQSYLDLVRSKKVLVLFPATGSMELRDPKLNYLINYRISNEGAAAAITDYLFKKGQKKFAFLYRNDQLGKNTLKGATEALQTQNVSKWVSLPFNPGTNDFTQQLTSLQNEEFDTLGFFALGSAVKNFIKSVTTKFFTGKTLFGIDPLTEENFQQFVLKEKLTVAVPYQVPNPEKSEIPIVKSYVKAAKKKNQKLDPFALEGYIYISLLADVIDKIDQPLTKDKIVAALESLKDYDFKGITLHFDPEIRTLMHPMWVNTGKPKWEVVDFKVSEKKLPEKPSKQHVIEGNVKIGSTLDLSRSEKVVGRTIRDVLENYMSDVNQAGGIKDRKIDLTIYDDGYVPDRSIKNVYKLINQNSALLLNPLGSPNLTKYLPLVKSKDVMVFFPYGWSPLFYDSSLQNLLNFGPSYYDEAYFMVYFAHKRINFKNIILFYQQTTPLILEGARKALKELGKEWEEVAYNPSSVNYKEQIQNIKKKDPDAFLFLSIPIVTVNLIRQLGTNFFVGKSIFCGISFLNVASFKDFMKSNGLYYAVPSHVPNPQESNLPIVKDFREFARAKSIDLTPTALFSYISAQLLQNFISGVKNKLTWKNIMRQAESFKDVDLGGMKFSFNPETRNISNTLWIDTGIPDWHEEQIKNNKRETTEKIEKEIEPSEVKTTVPEDMATATEQDNKEKKKSIEFEGKKIDGPIKVGSTVDLSKGIKVLGRRVTDGTSLALNYINTHGGIDGNLIDLTIFDDGYTPRKARKNIERFIKNNINIILNPLGGPTLESYLDLTRSGTMLVLFPKTGIWSAYKAEYINLINFRASYYDVGYMAAVYAIENINAKKIAIFVQKDVEGEGDGARDAFNKKNFKNWVEIGYTRNDVSFKNQANKIKEENPDAIIFYSVASATKELIRQVGMDFIGTRWLIGATDHAEKSFKDYLQDKGLKMSIFSPVPNPQSSDLEIAQEFRKRANKANLEIDAWSFESYIGASLLIHALKMLHDNFSIARLRSFFEQMKNVEYKGLKLDFNQKTRQLQQYIWLDTGEEEWLPMKVAGKPAP